MALATPSDVRKKQIRYITGGLAAMGAGFFTNPIDVVKTRLQLQVSFFFFS